MQRLSPEDRIEIYELYARYSWALDTGDTEGYVALFTEDAEATEETRTGAVETFKGRAAIRDLVLKFHKRADFPGHQLQMAQFSSSPIRSSAHCTGWCARTRGRRSTTRRRCRHSSGAATCVMSSPRSTVPGRSAPRPS